jgi:hypothetical protein
LLAGLNPVAAPDPAEQSVKSLPRQTPVTLRHQFNTQAQLIRLDKSRANRLLCEFDVMGPASRKLGKNKIVGLHAPRGYDAIPATCRRQFDAD